ncbi:MAG: RNA polymerase sigma factor [Candidatus Hodarchaeales archaeon]|jgi:RNA polymerase sigma-70 factor (ECF subfamily)
MDINELYKSARNGNNDAKDELFRILFIRFRLLAIHIVREEQLAEDIAQDALLVILNKLGTIEIETSFSAWAYKILRNTVIRCLKKRNRRRVLLEEALGYSDVNVEWNPDRALERNIIRCLRLLMKKNSTYIRALNLRNQGFKTEEITKKLGMNRNNLYQIYRRARMTLKKCIESGGRSI